MQDDHNRIDRYKDAALLPAKLRMHATLRIIRVSRMAYSPHADVIKVDLLEFIRG